MINQYHTLLKLTDELQPYTGYVISSCFTQDKDTTVFSVETEKNSVNIIFSAVPGLNCLYYKENFNRAKANSADIFPDIVGEAIQNIELLANNRIIKISLINTNLYFYLFGSAQSNLIVAGSNGIIIDSVNYKQSLIGKEYKIPSYGKNNPDQKKDLTIIRSIINSGNNLERIYSDEICSRLGFYPDKKLSELNTQERASLTEAVDLFVNNLEKAEDILILMDESGNKKLSLTRLADFPYLAKKYDSVSSAIEDIYIYKLTSKIFHSKYKILSAKLNNKIKKLNSKINSIGQTDKTKKRMDDYTLFAKLLQVTGDNSTKGMKSIILDDWDGNKTEIKLDEKLTLMENSIRYFDKVKSAREKLHVNEEMLPGLIKELKLYSQLNEELEKIENVKSLKQFEKKLGERKILKDRNIGQNREERFKEFELPDGFIAYAGKNAANNDELTVKFARPYDMWFHARGAGGSHVVLRLEKSAKKPPKYIIEKTASIAAYYSKYRKAKMVPVAYTYKKFVRKPKGANPGTVTMAREEVIMVRPELPGQES